jgi:uncharacterized membrane protein YhhN
MSLTQQLLPLAPVLLGPIAALLTQVVKDHPKLPINAGNVALLRLLLALLAVAGAVLLAWLEGRLGTLDFKALLQNLLDAFTIYVTAVTAYEHSAPALPPADPQP